jgi:Zn-dependent protease
MRFSFDTGSFEVGRYRGAPVALSPTFFITAVVLAIPFLRMFSLRGLVLAGFFIAMFFLSILIHELAHAVMATNYRVQVARIEINMAGGLVSFRGWPRTMQQDLLITLAGPISNLALALVALALLMLVPAATPDTIAPDGRFLREAVAQPSMVAQLCTRRSISTSVSVWSICCRVFRSTAARSSIFWSSSVGIRARRC